MIGKDASICHQKAFFKGFVVSLGNMRKPFFIVIVKDASTCHQQDFKGIAVSLGNIKFNQTYHIDILVPEILGGTDTSGNSHLSRFRH